MWDDLTRKEKITFAVDLGLRIVALAAIVGVVVLLIVEDIP
jgi:hypothetical protein